MEIAARPYTNAIPFLSRTGTASPLSASTTAAVPSRPAMQTSYASASPLVHSQAHTGSSYSIQSQPSSRSSDTTQGTAQSTLFPPMAAYPPAQATPPAPNGNEVMANDNVMNSVADASSSLFQICVALRQRLMGVPGFAEVLAEVEEHVDDDVDPVTLLWRTFLRGDPLMLLHNTLRPGQPFALPTSVKEEKRGKAAAFKFLQACITDLKIPQEELFIITDLYGDDTTGFVKVARVVNRVLDELVRRGLVEDVRPTASDFEQAVKGMKRTQRQHIISELVTTERTYVQHLERLQAFKRMVEERGVIPGDACHNIFHNLNALLDVQRRFLIRVEQTNALPEEEQNWGNLFKQWGPAFEVYEPYIANQAKCEKTVVAEFSKLKDAGGTVEMRQMVESAASLYGFLMKPFQRLSKYPLLLEEIYKKGDLDESRKADLVAGKEAATAVLTRINMAVDQQARSEAVEDLKERVEDWKGHKIEGFGDLLLNGTYTVLKSENIAAGKDTERQYHVYLFQTILLCCKNVDPLKPKNKLSASRNVVDNRGKPKLQLKGRIFMQNVTDLVSLAKPGSYTCQIFWKGDPGIENFIIRLPTEEILRKWTNGIENQRRKYRESNPIPSRQSDSFRSGTSNNQFVYLQNQPQPENPYKHQYDAEDDEEYGEADDAQTFVGSAGGWSNSLSGRTEYTHNPNGSTTSLRSRSTTGESTKGPVSVANGRAHPPRFAPGSLQQPPLALRTQNLQSQVSLSPGNAGAMDSYFSPTGESPASSLRTSASSGLYPFPTQQIAQNGYFVDGQSTTRFTAPAMPRQQPARESSGPSNGYAPPGRVSSSRPSFSSGMHSSHQLPTASRNRSASSPDIQHGQRIPMRGAQPPVPDMPAPYQNAAHIVNRSQNNSPSMTLGRASPQVSRDRNGRQEPSPGDYVSYASAPQNMRMDPTRVSTPQQMQGHTNARVMAPAGPLRTSSQQAYSPGSAAFSQPPSATSPSPSGPFPELGGPAQLRVKVRCPSVSQVLTLVVPTSITYQSLKDRIEAKLQRSTNLSLGDRGPKENHVKLKYLDEEDYVSIQSDEDVQTAFETWREAHGAQGVTTPGEAGYGMGGLLGEIELFCQR